MLRKTYVVNGIVRFDYIYKQKEHLGEETKYKYKHASDGWIEQFNESYEWINVKLVLGDPSLGKCWIVSRKFHENQIGFSNPNGF